MSATSDVVRENAAYHAQLLAAIAELDYIPSAVEQQDSYIAGLEHQSRLLGPKIASLEMQTKKEREEHQALRDSATRRFAATITGRKDKYEAKASKEEREYVEALEKEMQHKRQQAALETMITEAKTLRRDLQSKLERYNKAKQDLAALYSKIFDGPTQAFPEDDQLEYQLQQAQGRYDEIQGYLNRESQAVNLLQSAHEALQSCYSEMQEAIDDSHWDMFGGFGAVDDIMERQDLSAAQEKATQAQMFVQQAIMISPQVQPVGEITIAHGSFMTDVVFDNIFTDMAFHEKIKASVRNVQNVQINVMNQLGFAQGRAGAIGADLNVAADALTHARGALDAFRRRVFDSTAGNDGNVSSLAAPAGPPPGYSATEGLKGSSNNYAPPPGPPPPPPSQVPTSTSSYAPPPGPSPAGSSTAFSSAWSGHTLPPPPGYPSRGPEPTSNDYNYSSPPPQVAGPSSSYAPPPGPPPPTHPEQGSDMPLPPPMYSGYAAPPGAPPPQVSMSTPGYAPPLGPPPANSRAASPSGWAPPAGPPPAHSAPHPPHPSSYALPPGPPPPLPPTRSRPASPSSWGARHAASAGPPPGPLPPQLPETTRPLDLLPANFRPASPSAWGGRTAPPLGYPAPPMPPNPESFSAPPHAPQPTSGYAPPPGPPPPRVPESTSYAAPPGPPPADSRAASPSASGSHNSGLRPTNSTSPRPTTNSTSPRPPAKGTAASSPFPLPRASQSTGSYVPPSGPPQHLQPESSSLERPRAASPSAWGHRNPYAAALATGVGR